MNTFITLLSIAGLLLVAILHWLNWYFDTPWEYEVFKKTPMNPGYLVLCILSVLWLTYQLVHALIH